jgi:hypothetical protein
MSLNAFPALIFRADAMPRITCLTCGTEMCNDHREAVTSFFEIRRYLCFECDIEESFVIDLQTTPK